MVDERAQTNDCASRVVLWPTAAVLAGEALADALARRGFAVSVAGQNESTDFVGAAVIVVADNSERMDVPATIESVARTEPGAGIVLIAGSEIPSSTLDLLVSTVPTVSVVSTGSCLEELDRAVRDVSTGKRLRSMKPRVTQPEPASPDKELTDRELDVLRLVAKGHRNQDVAQALAISVHTVRTHMQNILAKLGVGTRLAAVTHAQRTGLLESRAS
jgi:DNA-binding NarL/FixJ family response regulator